LLAGVAVAAVKLERNDMGRELTSRSSSRYKPGKDLNSLRWQQENLFKTLYL
jgi:hypothetical protein